MMSAEEPRRAVVDDTVIPPERVYRQITIPEETWRRMTLAANELSISPEHLGLNAIEAMLGRLS
jgi:hypothetical protein